ncbi:MAG: hypothetical protein ACI4GZ_06025 [Ruminococcus sp.]
MKKPNKRDSLNLVFSAFLILGYIVCTYFFLNMTSGVPRLAPYINALVFTVFGLVVFYATRVGEGKPVKRFSLFTLIILDIPALYIILAQLIEGMPLHTFIANLGGTTPLTFSPIFILACVALGYGIPYTFFSGYEISADSGEDELSQETAEGEEADEKCGGCETSGKYTLCDESTEGALMVVDDMDSEFDSAKEIKISDAVPCDEEVKVGSFVVFCEPAPCEEVTEA